MLIDRTTYKLSRKKAGNGGLINIIIDSDNNSMFMFPL